MLPWFNDRLLASTKVNLASAPGRNSHMFGYRNPTGGAPGTGPASLGDSLHAASRGSANEPVGL
jgi:hypothetical protein